MLFQKRKFYRKNRKRFFRFIRKLKKIMKKMFMKTEKELEKQLISFKFRAMASNAAFTQKLHLIYLINDLLHHWLVKNR